MKTGGLNAAIHAGSLCFAEHFDASIKSAKIGVSRAFGCCRNRAYRYPLAASGMLALPSQLAHPTSQPRGKIPACVLKSLN